MPKKTYLQAINEAVRQEMKRDSRVIVLGEDVAGGQGATGEPGASAACSASRGGSTPSSAPPV